MKMKTSLFAILMLLLASCGSKKNAVTKTEQPADIVLVAKKPLHATRSLVVEEARMWLGTPYRYGGEDKGGVDCSGMVMKVYMSAAGIKLPRSSREQQKFANPIKKGEIDSGDLIFFSSKRGGGNVSHVGISIGGNEFIHSSTSRGVIISSLNEDYYTNHYHSAGRVLLPEKPEDCVVNDSTASVRPGDIEARAIRDAVRRAMQE